VGTHSGIVRVRPGENGSVRVRGILRARRSLLSDTEEWLQNIAANPPIEQSGDSVRIGDVHDRWLLRGFSILLDIVVPADTRVRTLSDAGDIRIEDIAGPVICETDAGRIEVSGIGSHVRASADSGRIVLRKINGPVDASADSGDIEALDIAGAIAARTDSGSIRLSQTVAASVRAEADSGSIALQLVPEAGYNLRVRTDSGKVRVPEMAVHGTLSRHAAEGQIRGGGPSVHLETDSGSIEVW